MVAGAGDQDILDACDELGIGFVPYSPLGKGFLTGGIDTDSQSADDFSASVPRFQPEAMADEQGVRGPAQARREREGRDARADRPRMAVAQRPYIVPIPVRRSCTGSKRMSARASVELTDADLREINEGASKSSLKGTAMPAQMAMVGREAPVKEEV